MAAIRSEAQGQTMPCKHVRPSEFGADNPLPTEGYMDHMTVDIKGQRLFLVRELLAVLLLSTTCGQGHSLPRGSGDAEEAVLSPETDEIWLSLTDAWYRYQRDDYEITKIVKLAEYAIHRGER